MLERIIVISSPKKIKGEAELWLQLFYSGLQKLHIRKPEWTNAEIVKLIEQIPVEWRKKMVIHHNDEIRKETDLGGVHFSYNQFESSRKMEYSISYSVHNWQEMEAVIQYCDYALISPVCNSISKQGYSENKALHSVPQHLRNEKIVALGGIDISNLENVFNMGYYGAALLGYLWAEPSTALYNWQQLLIKLAHVKVEQT